MTEEGDHGAGRGPGLEGKESGRQEALPEGRDEARREPAGVQLRNAGRRDPRGNKQRLQQGLRGEGRRATCGCFS